MDKFIAYLMIIAEIACVYFFRRHIKKSNEQEKQKTPEQKSIERYGFDMFSVSRSIDNASNIRKQLEKKNKELELKNFNTARENLNLIGALDDAQEEIDNLVDAFQEQRNELRATELES